MIILFVVLATGCATFGSKPSIYDELEDFYQTLPKAHTRAALGLTERARDEYEDGKNDRAIDTLNKALLIDPHSPFAYFFLGKIHYEHFQHHKSLGFLAKARRLFRNFPFWKAQTYKLIGLNWTALGKTARALESYKKAKRTYPKRLTYRRLIDTQSQSLMDYKETLNLPKTDFPMKAKLTQKEPELLKKWESTRLYETIIKKNSGKPPFVLHDGPPYANSPIHVGTALNKILKDIVVRYKNMSGYVSEYVPGWDCHGLPIELAAMKKMGSKKASMSVVEFRKACQAHAEKFIDIQREQFKRLGVMGEWNNPYLTMSPEYEAQVIRELGTLSDNGLLYRGKKSIHWCPTCQTALAEAEIEHADKTSPSIYVKFELIEADQKKLSNTIPALKDESVSLVIWTTTPWTIPANMAIALHPDFRYVALATEKGTLIVAKNLAERFAKECGLEKTKIVATLKADDLVTLKCHHPFLKKTSLIILGDHVTDETGTGCVHTAPGHGADDYFLGLKYKLDIFSPVDHRGQYTDELPEFKGLKVLDANPIISKKLLDSGHLLAEHKINHSYPHCWRCKKPVIFRATEQWFVGVDEKNLRGRALKWIEKVKWIPIFLRAQALFESIWPSWGSPFLVDLGFLYSP